MRELKVVINASNLHVGGGVQVATSFVDELTKVTVFPFEIHVIVSSEVDSNLLQQETNFSKFDSYEVFDTYGLSTLWSGLGRKLRNVDLVFTVFGPLYIYSPLFVNVVGFAQPWILYPDNEIYRKMPLFGRVKSRLKFAAQSVFFKRATRLVVELEHAKARLVERGISDEDSVDVVYNCLSSLYFDQSKWCEVCVEKNPGAVFSVGLISRDYPHKNISILPDVKSILFSKHGLEVDFFVTLNESEWLTRSELFRQSIRNVGALSVAQCPRFYQQMDAVIFPSLLECFSATPLEALFMEKPLFASSRGFVRDVCGDYANYFDPIVAESAADIISKYIKEKSIDKKRLAEARQHVVNFSSAGKRARDYLGIISSSAKLDS